MELSSNSPAVLDAPLTVTATLGNIGIQDGPFVFSFSDNAYPTHYKETDKSNNLTMNFTMTYQSDQYYARHYTVTCRVYAVSYFLYWDKVAENSTRIQVRKTLSGHVSVVQKNVTVTESDNTAVLRTKVMSEFKVNLHDPEDYLQSFDILYYWFINDTSYGNTESSFLYNFTIPGNSSMEVFVYAQKKKDNKNETLWDPWWSDSYGHTNLVDRIKNIKAGLFLCTLPSSLSRDLCDF